MAEGWRIRQIRETRGFLNTSATSVARIVRRYRERLSVTGSSALNGYQLARLRNSRLKGRHYGFAPSDGLLLPEYVSDPYVGNRFPDPGLPHSSAH